MAKVRSLAWAKGDPFGAEFARAALAADSLQAVGVTIGSEPVPYRLDYLLETGAAFVTTRVVLETQGQGWRRALDLRRSEAGVWSAHGEAKGARSLGEPGGDLSTLAGALDCDIQYSPLTNAMPVLRHGLLEGDSAEFTMAWVSVPDLKVHADGQRYTFLRKDGVESIVRFEALDGSFTADVRFDADGLVVDYPGIARRIAGSR